MGAGPGAAGARGEAEAAARPAARPEAGAAAAGGRSRRGAAEVLAAVDAVGVAADGLEYAQAEAMAEVIADEEAPVAEQEGGPVVENVDD